MRASAARGFAGLATLVSEVSVDIVDAERLRGVWQPSSRASRAPAAPAVIRAPLGGLSVGMKWALSLGVLILVGWFIGFLGERASTPPVTPPAVQIPSAPLAPVAVPSAPPAMAGLDLFGVKPPVGGDLLLDPNQIRYCLVEKIRLATISPLVDTLSDHDVDRFNARVVDFNGRCAKFRYRRGTLEQARQEVETLRPSIENLARREWKAEK